MAIPFTYMEKWWISIQKFWPLAVVYMGKTMIDHGIINLEEISMSQDHCNWSCCYSAIITARTHHWIGFIFFAEEDPIMSFHVLSSIWIIMFYHLYEWYTHIKSIDKSVFFSTHFFAQEFHDQDKSFRRRAGGTTPVLICLSCYILMILYGI